MNRGIVFFDSKSAYYLDRPKFSNLILNLDLVLPADQLYPSHLAVLVLVQAVAAVGCFSMPSQHKKKCSAWVQ